jgi:hypothetical protein
VRLARTARRGVPLAFALLVVTTRAKAEDPTDDPPHGPYLLPPGNPSQFSLKLAAGADYRNLFGVPIYGGDGSVSLGTSTGVFAAYGTLGVMSGSTQYGLHTSMYRLGFSMEIRTHRFSFGCEIRPSYLNIERVTNSSAGNLGSLGFGFALYIAFDVAAWREHAVFLAATLDVDDYGANDGDAVLWGPALSIGFRER